MNSEPNENMSEKIFYIKAIELEFLLAAAGMDSWYGLPVNGLCDSIKKEDVHIILAELYHKGYINWGKPDINEIVLQEPASTMVQILRDADSFLKLEFKEENRPVLMVYLKGDQCLYLGESPLDKKTFRFKIEANSELERFIQTHSEQIKNIERRKS